MCEDEGVVDTTGFRDPGDQLAQEERESPGNRVLLRMIIKHESVVCFRVAEDRLFNVDGVV